MAQALKTTTHRPAPLEIRPEARPLLTEFREGILRALYDAAMSDGGADIVAQAYVYAYEPQEEDAASVALACWVDGTESDQQKTWGRMVRREAAMWQSWSVAEREEAFRVRFSAPLTPERLAAIPLDSLVSRLANAST